MTGWFRSSLQTCPNTVSDNLAALRIKDLLTMSVGNAPEPTHVNGRAAELGQGLPRLAYPQPAGHSVPV